jgi:hypothetical protein
MSDTPDTHTAVFILSSSNDADFYGVQQMDSIHPTLHEAKQRADSRSYRDQHDTIEEWIVGGIDYVKCYTLITRDHDGATYWSDEDEPPGRDRPPRNDREILRLDAWFRAAKGEQVAWKDTMATMSWRAQCRQCIANGGVWCDVHAAEARRKMTGDQR